MTVDNYRFRACWVNVVPADRYLRTVFDDGAIAEARPGEAVEDGARAAALGYGADLWRCTVDHELLHTVVSELLGHDYSPVLWAAAHRIVMQFDPRRAQAEESLVLGLQSLRNGERPCREVIELAAALKLPDAAALRAHVDRYIENARR